MTIRYFCHFIWDRYTPSLSFEIFDPYLLNYGPWWIMALDELWPLTNYGPWWIMALDKLWPLMNYGPWWIMALDKLRESVSRTFFCNEWSYSTEIWYMDLSWIPQSLQPKLQVCYTWRTLDCIMPLQLQEIDFWTSHCIWWWNFVEFKYVPLIVTDQVWVSLCLTYFWLNYFP
jgi:hypothetical protein